MYKWVRTLKKSETKQLSGLWIPFLLPEPLLLIFSLPFFLFVFQSLVLSTLHVCLLWFPSLSVLGVGKVDFFSLNKRTQKQLGEKRRGVTWVVELGFPTPADDAAGDTGLVFLSGSLLGIDKSWLESGSWRKVDKWSFTLVWQSCSRGVMENKEPWESWGSPHTPSWANFSSEWEKHPLIYCGWGYFWSYSCRFAGARYYYAFWFLGTRSHEDSSTCYFNGSSLVTTFY